MRRNASTHKLLPENEFEDFKEWSLNFLKADRVPMDADQIRNGRTRAWVQTQMSARIWSSASAIYRPMVPWSVKLRIRVFEKSLWAELYREIISDKTVDNGPFQSKFDNFCQVAGFEKILHFSMPEMIYFTLQYCLGFRNDK